MSAAQRSTIATVLRHEARAVLKNRGVLLFGGGILLQIGRAHV